MDIYEVVVKLTGSIKPVGETHTDNERFDNLQVAIELVDRLMRDIMSVSRHREQEAFSVKRAGEKAFNYLKTVKAELEDHNL